MRRLLDGPVGFAYNCGLAWSRLSCPVIWEMSAEPDLHQGRRGVCAEESVRAALPALVPFSGPTEVHTIYRRTSWRKNCGEANAEGRELAERCRTLRDDPQARRPICLLSGGEPIVHLARTDKPRKGGRNQQLVLSGLEKLKDDGMDRIVLLSGGTDGEDGPTDAAGAWADAGLLQTVRRKKMDMSPYLAVNDSYSFFEYVGGLMKTGPTHTNVMDLRVALIGD